MSEVRLDPHHSGLRIPAEGAPVPGADVDLDGAVLDPVKEDEPPIATDASFFGWLKGEWVFDRTASVLPLGADVVVAEDITLTISDDGSCRAEAPRIIVKHELGEFIASIGLAGRLAVTGKLDEAGRVPLSASPPEIVHRNLDFSGWKLPFDVSFIANPLFDLIVSQVAGTVLLAIERDATRDILALHGGPYVHRLYRPRFVAQVLELTFDDQRVMRATVEAEATLFRSNGVAFEGPQWVRDARNEALSYDLGATPAVTATVHVSKPGYRFKLLGICKESSFASFESDVCTSTGVAQPILMHAKGRLPAATQLSSCEIIWNVLTPDDGHWYFAGRSGSHRFYTVPGKAISLNSFGKENAMTDRRMAYIMKALSPASEQEARDIQAYARKIQVAANQSELFEPLPLAGKRIVAHPASTLNANGRAQEPKEVWSLLDFDSTDYGNCGEATLLMESMLRLLGIVATQTHVLASSKLDVCQRGQNFRAISATGSQGAGYDTRYCEHHNRQEELSMAFNTQPPEGGSLHLNDGEGCVEVEGGLYAGLIPNHATDTEGRKAAYNMLLQLEQEVQSGRPNPVCHFQVWTAEEGAITHVCEFDSPVKSNNTISHPFGVPVPTWL